MIWAVRSVGTEDCWPPALAEEEVWIRASFTMVGGFIFWIAFACCFDC